MNGHNLSWRPIATGPRGENILVYSLRWGVVVASFDTEAGALRPRLHEADAFTDAEAALITHWMPLPAVPHELTRARSPWHSLAA